MCDACQLSAEAQERQQVTRSPIRLVRTASQGLMAGVLLVSFGLRDPGHVVSGQSPRGMPQVNIVIDDSRSYQTMDGFGVSQRVWRDGHLANPMTNPIRPSPIIPQRVQQTILTQLFTELGLTRVRTHGVRYRTGPVEDGHPGGPQDVDNRIAFVKQSFAYGLRTVISENNPVETMTAADYEQHAANTLALLLYWRAKGVEPPYQTLMNEPTENQPWADGVWHRNVIKALGPRMRAAGLKTTFVVPDELNACRAYLTAKMILEDRQARPYVGALAYHMYGGTAACLGKMAELSRTYKVPLWMTEHSREPGFEGSLGWANEVHDLIANYQVGALDYMWGFFGDYDQKKWNAENFIDITFGPNATYTSHRRTSKYYVTGQFSRFVRPGDVRIGVESDSSEVRVTAYRGTNRLVIVLINDGHAERSITITARQGRLPRSLSGVRSSRFEQWESLASPERAGSAFLVTLPPQSVTTLWGNCCGAP